MADQEMAENISYKVLHGIVDCLWIIGEPISGVQRGSQSRRRLAYSRKWTTTYDWITFLSMNDGTGAYNLYFGRLNTAR